MLSISGEWIYMYIGVEICLYNIISTIYISLCMYVYMYVCIECTANIVCLHMCVCLCALGGVGACGPTTPTPGNHTHRHTIASPIL